MRVDGLYFPPRPHVYPIREDTLLLAEAVEVRPGERFLEVGCGLGLTTLLAARFGARAIASDRNPHAVRAAREFGRERGLPVEGVIADLLEPFQSFDVVAFNPPYLPTTPDLEREDRWTRLALDGGTDGLSVLSRFLKQLNRCPVPSFRAYVLVARVSPGPDPLVCLAPEMSSLAVRGVRAERHLPGEHLRVVELGRKSRTSADPTLTYPPETRPSGFTNASRRSEPRPLGTVDRPRFRPADGGGSNPPCGTGQRIAPGAA
jgi:release factor glutamine methyltransferase